MKDLFVSTPSVCPKVSRTIGTLHSAYADNARFNTIKAVRYIYGLELRPAKDLVEIVVDAKPFQDTCFTDLI